MQPVWVGEAPEQYVYISPNMDDPQVLDSQRFHGLTMSGAHLIHHTLMAAA